MTTSTTTNEMSFAAQDVINNGHKCMNNILEYAENTKTYIWIELDQDIYVDRRENFYVYTYAGDYKYETNRSKMTYWIHAVKHNGKTICKRFDNIIDAVKAYNRIGRLKKDGFGSTSYAKEELIAELTSALVCHRHGMDKHIKSDSAPYLKSWLESLGESTDFIKDVLIDVKKATSFIETHLIQEEEKTSKEEAA